jgi:hypothetical protein
MIRMKSSDANYKNDSFGITKLIFILNDLISFKIMEVNYIEILQKGKFYDPAYKHYDNKNLFVTCDRCVRKGLNKCYGYENLDLCIPCAKEIALSNKDEFSDLLQESKTDIDDSLNLLRESIDGIHTLMESNIYKSDEEDNMCSDRRNYKTKMGTYLYQSQSRCCKIL